ncbi:MAG TPA: hypothetical protein DET40_01055 [Lentisphaeria bacterium]|nr:MAG: hypothetical protein A2X45_25090 [Lentisphaerae bacterium GWF2_50_93]HCE42120.1 hypothetical protein [Lentisphaeria bacterium]
MKLKVEEDRVIPIEKCSCCGKMIEDGTGRFRKIENVFCLGCYNSEKPENIKLELKEARQNEVSLS